jgi:hypothetical protein
MVDEHTDLLTAVNDDVIVTDVRKRGEKLSRIVNDEDQRDTQSGERQAKNLHWQSVIRQGRTVLAGDYNSHSS